MIGQFVINMKVGGCGWLLVFMVGVFLMFLIVVLSGIVVKILMAVLVVVMVMVFIGIFDWLLIKGLWKVFFMDLIVMVIIVLMVVLINDLLKGVFVGVLLSVIFFMVKIFKLKIVLYFEQKDVRIYKVMGQIFFVFVFELMNVIDYDEDVKWIVIDLIGIYVWDDLGVVVFEKIVVKCKEYGIEVELKGLNQKS